MNGFRNIYVAHFLGMCLVVAFISACAPNNKSANSVDANSDSSRSILEGSMVVARPVPPIDPSATESMLGFLPFHASQVGYWLSIDTVDRSLTLMEGANQISSVKGEGVENLRTGQYQLLHKQRSALWYAPDDYFTLRNLSIPGPGDKSRYRRGALGSFVLFLDKDTPIHDGPVWSAEIGGVKLNEPDISSIYYRLPVGAPIEVK